VESQGAAADGPALARRDEEEARRRPEVVELDRRAERMVEAALEPPPDLGGVLAQAVLRVRLARIGDADLDELGGCVAHRQSGIVDVIRSCASTRISSPEASRRQPGSSSSRSLATTTTGRSIASSERTRVPRLLW